MNILETERLILSEFTPEDAQFIIALVNTPGWLKYIGDRNIKNKEQAISYLTNGPIKSYKENGFGLWRVELKETSAPIGMCGLLRRDYLEHPDIGFAFLPEYHDQGFAVEAAIATLSFAKDQLHLPTVEAITLPDNHKSIKLLEKIGMKYVQPVYLPLTNEELRLYRHNVAVD
jgi:RimJ/RimL family protein N-acetyltransferase